MLQALNERQQEAARLINGPLLIIAGAGSGKTRALTTRIAYMIQEQGVQPKNILAVTFTNKAANEMKERLLDLLGGQTHLLPHVGTFHSICVRILRKEIHKLGYENSFVIYDASDALALIKRILKEKGINEKQYYPKAIMGAISKAKNALLEPKDYMTLAEHNTFHNVVLEVYKAYARELKQASALDFDDIIFRTVQLFRSMPEVLDKYQDLFRYINVDEYQDTNGAQYELVRMLADKYRNICVIGDDWQSIYSWRGADMQNILSFERDYPDATVIKLEQNYRSPKTIVEAANAVIERNKQRSEKKLWTDKDNGERIVVEEAHNERAEGERIVDRIEELSKQGVAYRDIAILYRTNAQSRILEDCLLMRGLPYRIIGGVRFYERKEIKDMLAYLRCIHNPLDNISFLRIINTPTRKIGAKTVETIVAYAQENGISVMQAVLCYDDIQALSGRALKAVGDFAETLHEFLKIKDELAAAGILKHVITLTRYQQFLQDGTDEGEERFANVAELVNVASKYDVLEPGISLATFLEEVALVSDTDSLSQDENSVTLMTLHSSKGLEYPYVFMAGMEEGLFPSSRSQMEPGELEEERRIMYVGMTRAMEKLFLSFAKTRMLYGDFQYNSPSRFISEIPVEYLEERAASLGYKEERPQIVGAQVSTSYGNTEEPRLVYDDEEDLFESGDRVRHTTWGMGTVIELFKDKVVVVFDNPMIGRKVLLKAIAPLEKIIEY